MTTSCVRLSYLKAHSLAYEQFQPVIKSKLHNLEPLIFHFKDYIDTQK